MNNPLMYTDPSGYTWFTQLGNWLGSTGRTIAEVAVGIGVGIAVTALTGGLDLITVGVLCGMAAGASSGALSTAFSGGNFNDYLNAITQGATIGGLTGFATSGILAGICALGGIPAPFSWGGVGLGNGQMIDPMYTTYGDWFNSLTGSFLNNSVIDGVSNGALIGGMVSSANASLGTQSVLFLAKTSINGTTGSSDVYKYAMQNFPNEMNELIRNNCNPTFKIDNSNILNSNTMGQGSENLPLSPKAMTFRINPKALSSDKMEYLTIGHELQHALHVSRGWTRYWASRYGAENVVNISEVNAYEWTMRQIDGLLNQYDITFANGVMAIYLSYISSLIGIYP